MRKLLQYTGPFAANSTISIPAEYGTTYTHLGINYIKPKPSFYPVINMYNDEESNAHNIYFSTDEYRPLRRDNDIRINQKNYILNQNGVLEFDALGETSWEIQFLHSFPAETIVDIIIETQ